MSSDDTGTEGRDGGGILIDATPLQNEHRRRGIGRYVASIVGALMKANVSGWGLLGHPRSEPLPAPIAVATRTPRRLEFHGGWLANEILLPVVIRRAGVRSFHATDPRSVPDPRLVHEVVTVYDLTPLRDPAVWRAMWLDQRLGFRRMLSNARRAPVIIAISEAVKADLVESLGVGTERIHVVYPAVETERWESADEQDSRSGLLFVGAPDPHKNLGLVLEALTRTRRESRPDLTIVGPWTASSIANVTSKAASLGLPAPRFEPAIGDDRLRRLYGSSLALVMPSRREGFGLPALEAMAAGCPVIASDIPALVEIAGGAGLTVRLDRDAWAEAIEDVARNDTTRSRLTRAGHRRATEFSSGRTVNQLIAAYRALGVELGSGSGPS